MKCKLMQVNLFHDSLEISMPIYGHTEASRRSIYIMTTSGQCIRQSKIQFYKNIKRTTCHILLIENELIFNDKLNKLVTIETMV